MERNSVAPQKLAALFDDWMWLLDESAEAHVRTFCERQPEPSLADFQAEIDRLKSAAETVRLLCTDDVRTGLYWVRCTAFKELLASAAEGLVARLLDYVRSSARSNNIKVHEEYSVGPVACCRNVRMLHARAACVLWLAPLPQQVGSVRT